jgi:integrase
MALAEWERIKQAIDHPPPTKDERELAALYERAGEREQRMMALFATLTAERAESVAAAAKGTEAEAHVEMLLFHRVREQLLRKVGGSKADTFGQHLDDFLAVKRQRHSLGAISATRVRSCEQHVRTIAECFGRDTPISTLDEAAVRRYWQHLADKVQAGDIGRSTATDRWALFREWVRSVYAVPQPRNLADRNLRFGRPAKRIETWSVEEVQSLLTSAPHERFELWALLMLNCGMYSGDVSALRPDEVDWEQGRIIRRRSKTRHLDPRSSPTVNYLLWRRTFDLLKRHGQRTGERVLVNRLGKALVQQEYKSNGKMKNQDSIYECYRNAYPEPRKGLKSLRKTGATLLETHDVYCNVVECYLAHSPRTIADRHYRQQSQDRLDKALEWLGEKLGIK